MIELNHSDFDKFKKETENLANYLSDPLSDINIIISNKFDMHKKALILNKRLFLINNWSLELKKICDICIYQNEKDPKKLREFLLSYI
jgi:hypothetical protein